MITLPWVSKKEYERVQHRYVEALCIIDSLKRVSAQEQEQIRALLAALNNAKQGGEPTNPTVEPKTQHNDGSMSTGRGGWRGKAHMMSQSTFPAPKDSVAQLEERVKKEGGVI